MEPKVKELKSDPHVLVTLWPIFASAGLFAAMHIGQGVAPIPLFVLAVGLGYVYWRTHSLIPCIIVHLVLNVWSLVYLVVQQSVAAGVPLTE